MVAHTTEAQNNKDYLLYVVIRIIHHATTYLRVSLQTSGNFAVVS